MKRLLLIAAVILGVSGPAPIAPSTARADQPAAGEPTAEQIFERYVQAVGGEDAFRTIKARIVDGILENKRSNYYGRITEYRAVPDKLIIEFEMPGVSSATTGFDGVTAWMGDLSGSRIIEGAESQSVRESADFALELSWRKRFGDLRTEGIVDFEGARAYKVLAKSLVSGQEQTLYFDVSTSYLIGFDTPGRKSATPGGADEPPSRLIISEYQAFGPVKFATRFVQRRENAEITWWYTNIELNPESMPAFKPPADAKPASAGK